MEQPVDSSKARKLLRTILNEGEVTYAQPHALERLEQRSISRLDCVNVMRGGIVEEAEFDKGGWRHRVSTAKFTVVIEFLDEDEVLVVTAWRNQ